jgi:8-amino-7-oxononanoate synthase
VSEADGKEADVPRWDARVTDELGRVRAAGRWRSPRDLETSGAMTGRVGDEGREVVSFASNDYLGLTHHPAVVAAATEAARRWGTGTGASRLVVGSRPLHAELERELADWKGTEDAVLFPTGYHANLGVLTTFGTAGVTVLSDELNHASIVDGCRLARADVRVVRHRDLDDVDAHLGDLRGPALVVSDSAFSMDGDVADVEGLLTVCSWYGALLVLDEAHAVLGPDLPVRAAAAAGERRPHDIPLLRVGTLSKTFGSLGGFVAGPKDYVDLLRNRARSFIFTTASSPADTAAALAALRVVRSAEGAGLVARLRHHVDRLRPGHPTPILSVVLGDEAAAVAASQRLLERGLLVPAIRPPTVPSGTSRLRVVLSAAHTDEQVDRLAEALADLRREDAAGRRPARRGAGGAAGTGPVVGIGAGVGADAPDASGPADGARSSRPAAAGRVAAPGRPPARTAPQGPSGPGGRGPGRDAGRAAAPTSPVAPALPTDGRVVRLAATSPPAGSLVPGPGAVTGPGGNGAPGTPGAPGGDGTGGPLGLNGVAHVPGDDGGPGGGAGAT